jgi:rubredoxin
MKKYRYQCGVCAHVYDPAEGDPATGVPPGTAFEDLPDSWTCPDCGAAKADFVRMED